MSWRDFFYFSKGERSGLILLLCLITTAGIILLLNNRADTVPVSSTVINRDDVTATQTNVSNANNASNANDVAKENIPVQSSTAKNTETVPNRRAATESKTDTEKESVSERVNRLTSYSRPNYTRVEKFEQGTVVELNTADTTTLKKVPGIGSTFAKRIVSYRNLLGGYYSVTQLSEVYGIDEDRYQSLQPWFSADPTQINRLAVNHISQDSLQRHPYVSYAQARVIMQLRRQKGKLNGWENLQLLKEFTESDRIRLNHYLSFE